MKITEIAFTVYPVSDITRAREFYEETLGLGVYEEVDYEQEGGPAGTYWIEYEVNGSIFAISNNLELSQQNGVAFEVEDYEEAIAALKDAGVRFVTDRIDTPVCCLRVISDPDGNLITIHKRKT